jgi:hypothetical protein
MREEKRKAVEADAKREFVCELHGVPVTLPPAAKYKKDRSEKHAGPDLEIGKQAVLAVNRGMERKGLYLAVLVDWDDDAGWWYMDTDLYFVVLDRSTDKIGDRIGRIVHARWPNNRWFSNLSVVSWNPADFHKVS